MLLLSKNVIQVTLCGAGLNFGRLCSGARCAPRQGRQAQALPSQVGRENEEPGDCVAVANLVAQSREKVTVTEAAVSPENASPNAVNNNRNDNQTKKKKAGENSDFLRSQHPEAGGFRLLGHQ